MQRYASIRMVSAWWCCILCRVSSFYCLMVLRWQRSYYITWWSVHQWPLLVRADYWSSHWIAIYRSYHWSLINWYLVYWSHRSRIYLIHRSYHRSRRRSSCIYSWIAWNSVGGIWTWSDLIINWSLAWLLVGIEVVVGLDNIVVSSLLPVCIVEEAAHQMAVLNGVTAEGFGLRTCFAFTVPLDSVMYSTGCCKKPCLFHPADIIYLSFKYSDEHLGDIFLKSLCPK